MTAPCLTSRPNAYLFKAPCLVLLVSIAGIVYAQDPTPAEISAYENYSRHSGGGGFGGRGASQVTISPDGSTVAWVGPPPVGRGATDVWTMSVTGGSATRLNSPDLEVGRPRDIAWSPDGSSIEVMTEAQGQVHIYVTPPKGGAFREVISFKGQVGSPAWSPDGKSLAFLDIENATRVSGATQPFKPQTGVVGSKPDVKRLAIVDVESGRMQWASPEGKYVYEFGWAPDSKQIAVTAADPPGENNWWTAKLYAADAATGKLRLITTPDLQINEPRWSPDGKSIAYIGGLMSDFGSIGGDVYLAPAAGGKAVDLTPGIKGSPNSIAWMHGSSILVGETVEGETAFGLLDANTGKMRQLMRQAASFSGPDGRNSLALSNDERTVACASATMTHGTEIYAGPIDKPIQLTHWNDNVTAYWGKIQSVHWKSGGFNVQGWLVAPLQMEAGHKYPMIVQVHGGPAAAVTGSIGLGEGASLWSQAGYFVFMPNPRGSYGEGEDFTKANRKDFGYGDWRDIMAGVDQVLKIAPVDGTRLGLTGGSYGGYMTMWGVTQTTRFKAAVAVAGIANWKSYYGENSIDEWMIPFFGSTVYDDPAVYAKSSPIEFIKRVKTPTLIAVGEYDGECPPPQSYEFWHALQVLKVKSELLVYPGEGHGVRQPENRRDLTTRELAWFDYYLK